MFSCLMSRQIEGEKRLHGSFHSKVINKKMKTLKRNRKNCNELEGKQTRTRMIGRLDKMYNDNKGSTLMLNLSFVKLKSEQHRTLVWPD